jgi:RNA polymerase-binding transcription factor DksA
VKKSNSSSTKKRPSAKAVTTVRRPTAVKKKVRGKPPRRSAFTLEEVQEIAKSNALEDEKNAPSPEAAKAAAARKAAALEAVEQEKRVHAAASLADILGYNPASSNPREDEEKKIPRKHIRYYRLLVDLRDHVKSEISLHTEDTLKRSSKDESGDLSSYSQHIADAGTDTFDRDFALSLVSSEQEALFEIEEAIKRIKSGNYGTCELTGKPIAKDRLLAVPFARYSVESQAQMEKGRRPSVQRGGIFADASDADAAAFIRDDSDD